MDFIVIFSVMTSFLVYSFQEGYSKIRAHFSLKLYELLWSEYNKIWVQYLSLEVNSFMLDSNKILQYNAKL